MVSRRVAVTTAAFLLLVGFVAALLWDPGASKPYSSPTAIRTNLAYFQSRALDTNFPAFDTSLFKSNSIKETGTGYTVVFEAGEEPSWYSIPGAFSHQKADSSGTIKLGNGSVQLAFIGVASDPGRERSQPEYFGPDLKPADRNHPILKLEPYRQDLMAPRFIFTCVDLPEFVTRRFEAFDARTHFPLDNRNYPRGPFQGALSFDSPLEIWHQTPIELLITLSMGPAKTYSAPAQEGTELKFPGGALKLLAIAEGGLEVVHMGPAAPTNTVELSRSPARDRSHSTLVFYQWPRGGLLPWDLEFIDDSGRVMSAGYNAGSGPIVVKTVDCPRERLKELRVKQYPNIHTLSFTIPELPGLPEQNRNLQNLFDLHLPHLESQSLSSLKFQLGHLVQMDVGIVPLDGRALMNRSFKRVRTNTTPHALYEELSESLLDGYSLVSDPERNEIRSRRNPLAGPAAFLKALLRIR